MGESRQKQLLDYMVKEGDKWVNAQILAGILGVSTRQIRKYIVAINERCEDFVLIESGPNGYRLLVKYYFQYKEKVDLQKADTPQTRQNYIVQKLIAFQGGYDVFDLSDELHVSTATIENDLKSVRKKIRPYHLSLKRSKDNICIIGDEYDKRSLMRNMIMPDSYDFALKDEVQLLTLHYHFWDLRKNILRILVQENDLFSNDYTLNNIALHIIVMIDRIRSGATLDHSDRDVRMFQNSEQYTSAKQLAEYLSCTYDIQISDAELYYLLVTISNNTTLIDHNAVTIDNIGDFMEQKYIDIGEKVLDKVVQTYHLDPFDDDFKVRFIIHINNLFNRLQSEYLVRNPLTSKLKGTYPLIYDIAVFIAQDFMNDYKIHLTEDEIGFFALHIGGYFENNLHNQNKVSCIFIYADYYGIYKKTVEKISKLFSDTINFKHIVSLTQYQQNTYKADLIISTIDMNFTERYVIIDPFLTEENIDSIRTNANNILQNNRSQALMTYLHNFVRPNLFFFNPNFKDKFDAIEQMTKNAINQGFALESLTENVLQRESLSDTGFTSVAVPHSLQEDVLAGFLSFAICETPMPWGDKSVHIILLIGVNKDSRKEFTDVFDILVEILSEIQNVRELSCASDYDDFLQKLIQLIRNIS